MSLAGINSHSEEPQTAQWRNFSSIARARSPSPGEENIVDAMAALAANQRLLLANEQRTAGAAVEREAETLRKQVTDLKREFETGAQHKELAARLMPYRKRWRGCPVPTTNYSAPSSRVGQINHSERRRV
jgi:hypothetical protein